MTKRRLILFCLIAFLTMPGYAAADGGQMSQEQIMQNGGEGDSIDNPALSNTQSGQTTDSAGSGPQGNTLPCGVGSQGPCSQAGPGGINPVTGLVNDQKSTPCGVGGQGPCSKLGPGGVNPVTGMVNGQKSVPCGVGGQGPCSKLGPGGVEPDGKVIGVNNK